MRKNIFAQNEYYHIYNRGVDKRTIFENDNDYQRFLMCLYLSNSTKSFNISDFLKRGKSYAEIFNIERKPLVSLYAYVLMPNHFHLLLSEKIEGGISLFMQKLTTSYTMYFNKKNDRTGSLFQGTFKSKHIETEEYLKYLFAYIHANPFSIEKNGETGIEDTTAVLEYPYSSVKDYLQTKRIENSLIDTSFFFPDLVGEESILNQFEIWLHYHEEEISTPMSRGLTSRQTK